jgi:hypothetical protein
MYYFSLKHYLAIALCFVLYLTSFVSFALQQTPPSPGGSISSSPGSPTDVSAIAGNASAVISFTAPSSDGGSTITGYIVTSSGGQTAFGTASPITMTGLANGTTYTFTVSAFNNSGTGTASTASNNVTPMANISIPVYNGWNLLGNGFNNHISVASLFNNPSQILSVWKWDNTYSKWFYYSPSLSANSLSTYTSNQGYEVLNFINPGDGFWINAASNFTLQMPSGTAITNNNFLSTGSLALQSGWSLISIGQTKTPSSFNNGLSITPPTAGAIPNNLNSIWAWDSVNAAWFFYSPNLDSTGNLTSYVKNQGYETFTSSGLSVGMGFWVSMPAH